MFHTRVTSPFFIAGHAGHYKGMVLKSSFAAGEIRDDIWAEPTKQLELLPHFE